jgi:hypothetical protein
MRWLQASLLVLGLHQLGRAGNSLQDRDSGLVLRLVLVLVVVLLLPLGAAACLGTSWDQARPHVLLLPAPASAVRSPLRVYLSLARGPAVSHRTPLYHPQHPQQQQPQRQRMTRFGAGSLRLLLLLVLHQMQQALPEAVGAWDQQYGPLHLWALQQQHLCMVLLLLQPRLAALPAHSLLLVLLPFRAISRRGSKGRRGSRAQAK